MKCSRNHLRPIPGVEWQLLGWCNYRCEYCGAGCQHNAPSESLTMSNALIEKTLRVLGNLPDRRRIHFSGGEPTLHPRFIDVCASVVTQGHSVSLITNFSTGMKTFEKLIDTCGDKLEEIEVSLHLSQVDLSKFTQRLLKLTSMKSPSTKVTVHTVMLPSHFPLLQQLPEHFGGLGIPFYFQHLCDENGWVEYSTEVEQFLKGKMCKAVKLLRGKSYYGTMCHAGHLFFVVQHDGRCFRCYDLPFHLNYLGSVDSGALKLYAQAEPCLGPACFCRRPALFRMICYGTTSSRVRRVVCNCKSRLPTLRMRCQTAINSRLLNWK